MYIVLILEIYSDQELDSVLWFPYLKYENGICIVLLNGLLLQCKIAYIFMFKNDTKIRPHY